MCAITQSICSTSPAASSPCRSTTSRPSATSATSTSPIPVNPERLTRRAFLARPRTEGLWLRLIFRSGDLLEGLAPTDRSLLDALADDDGLFLTPPDTRSNTQRLYVPRSALTDLQLLAVITTPSRRQPRPAPAETLQDELFHLPIDPASRPN